MNDKDGIWTVVSNRHFLLTLIGFAFALGVFVGWGMSILSSASYCAVLAAC